MTTLAEARVIGAPSIDLGRRLMEALRSMAAAAGTLVSIAGEGVSQVFRTVVATGEALAPAGVEAAARVRAQVVEKAEYVGTETSHTIKTVSDELKDLGQMTMGAVDRAVAAGLHRLGVPTQDEFDSLSKRMDAIADTVERLRTVAGLTKAPHRRPQARTPRAAR